MNGQEGSTILHIARIGLILAAVLHLCGCVIERIDFDANLQRSVGRALDELEFHRFKNPADIELIVDSDSYRTYRYKSPPSKCAWEIDVSKPNLVVIRWRYVSELARIECNDLPVRVG